MPNGKLNDTTFWDAYANGEKALSPFLVAFAEKALAEARLLPGAHVLDIATASGTMAVVAAKAGMNVLAVDFSPAMVQQVASYHIPNIEVRQMNGQSLTIPDASFDAAFSMFGITLFDDWRAGLSEMARVLRSGGVGSIGTWPLPGGAAGSLLLTQLCAEFFPELPEPEAARGLIETRDPNRFRAAMLAAGFTDVKIVTETHDYLIGKQEMTDPDRLFTFNSQWKQLNNQQRSKILTTIKSRHPHDAPYAVPSTASIATARRI